MSTSKDVTLDDKYVSQSGRIYLSGTQALVRLLLLQRHRDKAAGLNTGGFVSGYRGSPLGGVDRELWQAKRFLEAEKIHFQPGLNEDLAATAIWGSQQVNLYPGAKVDGVFGLWYGKGPGVDRSMDALKHANAAGTSAHGGVLLVMGDDHGAESSTLAHQSEQVMAAAMIPVLNPATVQEFLDFGLLGYALSRFSGCWVGLKAISETVQSSAVVDADLNRVRISIPQDFVPPPAAPSAWCKTGIRSSSISPIVRSTSSSPRMNWRSGGAGWRRDRLPGSPSKSAQDGCRARFVPMRRSPLRRTGAVSGRSRRSAAMPPRLAPLKRTIEGNAQ